MDPTFVRAARDRRSGASEIGVAVAKALPSASGKREIIRAARTVLRAHPAMGPLWRLFALALEGGDVSGWPETVRGESEGVASAVRWIIGRRSRVLTHSASSSVVAALVASRARVRWVTCTESRPGAEGVRLARRLRDDGFETEVVADAAMAEACASADVVLVGADAVTELGVVNKIGTRLLALAAQEAGIPCYALAGTSKFVPESIWRPERAPLYDRTPLAMFDGIVTERGALSAAAVRRAARKIEIPHELLRIPR